MSYLIGIAGINSLQTLALLRKSIIVTTVVLALFSGIPDASAAAVAVSWTAPNMNEDGTPLTNLAGYELFYGTSSGNYGAIARVGIVTETQVTGLTPGIQYFFSIKSFNSNGVRSKYSTEESITVLNEPTPTITPAPTPISPTPSSTIIPNPTPTTAPTLTATQKPTVTPSPTRTPRPTPSRHPSPTPTPPMGMSAEANLALLPSHNAEIVVRVSNPETEDALPKLRVTFYYKRLGNSQLSLLKRRWTIHGSDSHEQLSTQKVSKGGYYLVKISSSVGFRFTSHLFKLKAKKTVRSDVSG